MTTQGHPLSRTVRSYWHPPDREIQVGEWNGFGPYLQDLANKKWGSKIRVPDSQVGCLPPQVKPSPFPFSIAAGAYGVYREDRRINHFQFRDYGSYWEVELDRFHPKYHPLDHLISTPFDIVTKSPIVNQRR